MARNELYLVLVFDWLLVTRWTLGKPVACFSVDGRKSCGRALNLFRGRMHFTVSKGNRLTAAASRRQDIHHLQRHASSKRNCCFDDM
jgi:hypothetical protein